MTKLAIAILSLPDRASTVGGSGAVGPFFFDTHVSRSVEAFSLLQLALLRFNFPSLLGCADIGFNDFTRHTNA